MFSIANIDDEFAAMLFESAARKHTAEVQYGFTKPVEAQLAHFAR